jgi:hypothetical protein
MTPEQEPRPKFSFDDFGSRARLDRVFMHMPSCYPAITYDTGSIHNVDKPTVVIVEFASQPADRLPQTDQAN